MPSDSKKLILALVSGLSLEQTKPFFLSLEKCGYRGDVCIVAGDLGVATQSFLRARRVQLIPFQKAFLKSAPAWIARVPGIFMSGRRRPQFDRHLAPAYMHPRCARYFFYQSFLQECGCGYSHIMLSDVRDVFFQNDPFAGEVADGVNVFLEERADDAAPSAATGVIVGTATALREHLARLTSALGKKRDRRPIDKVVHNHLLEQEPPAKLHRFENFSGPVLNLANVDPARLQFAGDGRVMNAQGAAINILHQHDRQPALSKKLMAMLT